MMAVFGGSFDPPHVNHTYVVLTVLQTTEVECVAVVPADDHPTKDHHVEFEHRYEMTSRAFSWFDGVYVSHLERNLPDPNYTIDTLDYLETSFGNDIGLIVGTDCLRNFPEWERSDELVSRFDIFAVVRDYVPPGEELKDRYPVDNDDFTLVNPRMSPCESISSTEIRGSLLDDNRVDGRLDRKVLGYIEDHDLYSVTP